MTDWPPVGITDQAGQVMRDATMPEFVRDPKLTLSVVVPAGCELELFESNDYIPQVRTTSLTKMEALRKGSLSSSVFPFAHWHQLDGDELDVVALTRTPVTTVVRFDA